MNSNAPTTPQDNVNSAPTNVTSNVNSPQESLEDKIVSIAREYVVNWEDFDLMGDRLKPVIEAFISSERTRLLGEVRELVEQLKWNHHIARNMLPSKKYLLALDSVLNALSQLEGEK